MDIRWFNVSSKMVRLKDNRFRLWNLFIRDSTGGFWWGFGIFQFNQRHLFYLGHAGWSILWMFKPTKLKDVFVWLLREIDNYSLKFSGTNRGSNC